jgi:hypothetical protein
VALGDEPSHATKNAELVEPDRESPTWRETVAGPVGIRDAAAPDGDEGADAYIGESLDPDYRERRSQEAD